MLTTICFIACNTNKTEFYNLTQYVKPHIGTGGHGHVFLGANVPRGFVQLGPTQNTRGWDWCSGYHYSDSIIVGFSHLHLSGTGIGDLGDITFMPATDGRRAYSFERKFEIAKPGYYSVWMPEADIAVELTATARVGMHRYFFPPTDQARIVVDLKRGIGWDNMTEAYIIQENDTVISGYRKSRGWAEHQEVYFNAIFSQPITKFITSSSCEFTEVFFDMTQEEECVVVKVGLSPVSTANAQLNRETEIPGWNFEEVYAQANQIWNEELNKAVAKTKQTKYKNIYYTALYHSLIAPSIFCDVNGDYRGADGVVYRGADFVNYTTFSLWDTYRAAHPLATIIHPEVQKDYAQTILHIFEQQGKLPVWHLMGNETNCMVGNPGIPVLADLVLKGFVENKEAAYHAMKTSAMLEERSLGSLKEYGYIPFDKEPTHETVAKGLEYALADWCVAQIAKLLNKEEDYTYFMERSKSYTYYFDKNTNFMRALSAEKTFSEPFNPFHAAHRTNDYTEGNAWQYTWLVPHDVHGLIGLFGSEEAFITKLDSLFTITGDLGEHASPDISGLIGQYAHGNEPSHHIIYMYPFVGQQWKSAEKARQILTELYDDTPDGLCGNEDVGQMSAWYILSSWGLYQVAPAGGVYVFGSPLFDEITVKVGNDKTFTIIAHNNSDKNKYIQRVKLNGKSYTKSYIIHEDIVSGGKLEFYMGSEPSTTFGIAEEDRP
ncbi:GH92 family glycosyl hydrolase [Bacteroides sp. 214]|uniref:GH92 family glycosyl hydrolase n=1 Tax=Bacteroides sp. 214 TaxID=2302935 RepID=UPI001EF3D462|nr:GH92 family glycosyl hydrolase [Bacteroides sp. 214]